MAQGADHRWESILSNDVLARLFVTTIAVVALIILLVFDKADTGGPSRPSTDLSATHR
jgi:hypothetical protein